MTQPLVSEPCDTPDRVTIFMDVTDRPYFGRFLTTIADADERRMTTRRYRRRRRSNGRSRTCPVTKELTYPGRSVVRALYDVGGPTRACQGLNQSLVRRRRGRLTV